MGLFYQCPLLRTSDILSLACMKEREHWELADTFSEMMYTLLEADYREGRLDLDSEMRRLKDLSAYSLTHAEIMVQREGVELLALAKFFGLTSESRFHKNRERLNCSGCGFDEC